MDITVVTIAAMGIGCATLLGAFSAWLRYRARGVARPDAFRDERFEQLTDEVRALRVTVEAVAVEVERLGEGQRYTTRLVGERREASATTPPRVVTPH